MPLTKVVGSNIYDKEATVEDYIDTVWMEFFSTGNQKTSLDSNVGFRRCKVCSLFN
jgi:hypothetical protein